MMACLSSVTLDFREFCSHNMIFSASAHELPVWCSSIMDVIHDMIAAVQPASLAIILQKGQTAYACIEV